MAEGLRSIAGKILTGGTYTPPSTQLGMSAGGAVTRAEPVEFPGITNVMNTTPTTQTGSATAPVGSVNMSPGTGYTGSAPVSGGGTAPSQAALDQQTRDAIDKLYNVEIDSLNQLKSALPKQQNASLDVINNLYAQSQGKLDSAKAQGMRGVDLADSQNEFNRQQSLQGFRDSIQGGIRAFNNKLGTFGAGNSSAADILAPYAFSKMGAQGTTDINNQFNQQDQVIDNRRFDLEDEYTRQIGDLESWKNNQTSQIVSQYDALRSDILRDLNRTNAEKEIALAELNAGAVNSLAGVSQNYQQSLNALDNQFSNVGGPQVDTSGISNAGVDPLVEVSRRIDANGALGGGINRNDLGLGSSGLTFLGRGRDEQRGLTLL